MEKVKFCVTWSVYGYQTIDVPKHLIGASDEAIQEWIYDNWEDIPTPEIDECDEGSDEPDFESYFERWEEDT